MKPRKQSNEPDLYVSKRRMTEKERKELGEFIEKEREKRKSRKHRKAA